MRTTPAAVTETLAAPEASGAETVVFVEGISDRRALETLARRRGLDLRAADVAIVPIGGAQAIGNYLELFGPRDLGLRVAGLCDAPEERYFRRGLERAGLGTDVDRAAMERLGFYVCEANLEDELTRALGADAVEQIIDAQGDRGSFRTYQKQPAHRDRPVEEQVWGFMWNRKLRYATVLVEALDLTRVPRPLNGLLDYVMRPS